MKFPQLSWAERINLLGPDQNDLVLHLRVLSRRYPDEVRILGNMLRRRGGIVTPMGLGQYRLQIPAGLDWLPFFQTLEDCAFIEIREATTAGPKRIILPGGDDY